jgi:hypothetical protein
MLGFSYYDGLDNLLKDSNKKDNTDLQNKPSSIFKLTNSQSNQSKNTSSQEKYSIAHLSQKLKEDMPKLERFIKDREYRKKLENSFYPRYNPELFDIIGLQELVKEKIGIPENATIKYEKVKCSQECMHNHEYFYAYYWNSTTKKLRKKYIGKELPEPYKFTITYSME